MNKDKQISLHKKSKKIQKKTPSKTTQVSEKKYKTFNQPTKTYVLLELQKKVLLKLEKKLVNTLNLDLLYDLIEEEIDLEDYNRILKSILKNLDSKFSNETKYYTEWRKKIKSWINNHAKQETRGGKKIKESFKPLFNKYLTISLNKIRIRDTKDLKDAVQEALEQIRKDHPTRDDIPVSLSCSKHWWFNYQEANPDIKELWESFPLRRTAEAEKRNASTRRKRKQKEQTSTSLSSPRSILGVSEVSMIMETPETQLWSPYDEDNSVQSFDEACAMRIESKKNEVEEADPLLDMISYDSPSLFFNFEETGSLREDDFQEKLPTFLGDSQ